MNVSIKAKVPEELSARVKALLKALRSLSHEQSDRSRKYSTSAITGAIRKLKHAVDEAFPTIGSMAKRRKKNRPFEQRILDLTLAGWVHFAPTGISEMERLRDAGVPVRRVKNGRGRSARVDYWIVGWAYDLNFRNLSTDKLRTLARSPNARKIALAEAALAKQPVTP